MATANVVEVGSGQTPGMAVTKRKSSMAGKFEVWRAHDTAIDRVVAAATFAEVVSTSPPILPTR